MAIRYTILGTAGTSTLISSTVANNRQVNIFAGQLYTSDQSGSAYRLYTVGSGTPTTGLQTITNLPGFPISTGSPYAFFFADLDGTVPGVDTLYVADDAIGIQKYSLVSDSWTLNGVVGVDADDYRGLTGAVSGTTVRLYATRKGSFDADGGGELVSLVDDTGYNGTITAVPTLLATAATNMAFRGVAIAPTDNLPTVSSTDPANSTSNVAINTNITVKFSESVTAPAGAFTLMCGAANQSFGLSSNGADFILNPDNNLPLDTDCVLTVTASMVTDLDGTANAMVGDYSATFHTTADAHPSVASTVPLTAATNVAVENDISVTFNEDVTTSAAAFTILCDSVNQTFAFSGSGASYTLNPDSNLPFSQSCTVTVLASQVTDLDGTADAMDADYIWSFTTTYDPDAITPIATARTAGVGWTGTIQGNVTLCPICLAPPETPLPSRMPRVGCISIPPMALLVPTMALGDVVKVKGRLWIYGALTGIRSDQPSPGSARGQYPLHW